MERRQFVKLLGLGLLASACSAPAASPTAAPASPAPAKPASSDKPGESAAAQTAAPAQTKDLIKVKLVQSSPGLSYATLYIANELDLWAQEGLDLEWQLVQNGAIATTAVVNDEAQFAGSASSDPVAAWEKGVPLISIAGISGALTMNMGARRDWMQSKGITPQAPLKDRVAALKGARLGVPSVAGAPTQYAKYLIKSQGFDPESDVHFNNVGGGGARLAALRENQIDLFIGGIPDAEVAEYEGVGAVYINLGNEVPIFQDFTYEVVVVTRSYAEKNPEAVRRAARTIARANTIIHDDMPTALKALAQSLDNIPAPVMETAMKSAQKAFTKDAKMTQSGWQNAIRVMLDAGAIKREPPTAEGEIWTNRFLE